MILTEFKTGDIVRLTGGLVAEVVAPTEDGRWVRVRYISAPMRPELEGTEDLSSDYEVEEKLPARPSERHQG